MQSVETGNRYKKVFVVILIILVVLAISIGLMVGMKSLKTYFKWLIISLLIIAILFGLAYAFYLLFIKKEFKDIPATYRKKLVATAKLMQNNMLGELYLTGDSLHNNIKLGKYYYMKVPLPRVEKVKKTDTEGKAILNKYKNDFEYEEQTYPVDIDVFIVQRKSIIDKIFGEPLVILVKPEDHNYSAIFNNVYLAGFNLVPLDNNFYTIERRHLDIDISRGVNAQYLKEVVHEVMRNMDRMVKQAMGMDSNFQKDRARNQEFEIPKSINQLPPP